MKVQILKSFGPYVVGQVLENGASWMILKGLATLASEPAFEELFPEVPEQPKPEHQKPKAKIQPSNKAANKAPENK